MKKIITYILIGNKWLTIGETHRHVIQTATKKALMTLEE